MAHEDAILQLVYSPDGTRLASSSADRSVKIWDAATLTELHATKEPSWVVGLAYSPDGSRVVAGSFDGSVVLVEGK
jgi:WD40 repeat protein